MSNAEASKQVTDVQKIVKDTIGEEPQFFRPLLDRVMMR